MGDFKLPLEGIKYRIRNVDYRDYLERQPLHDNVVLRPEYDDLMQHWTFSVVDSKNLTVKIYDPGQRSTLYVESTSNTVKYGTPAANDEVVWKFFPEPLKDGKTYIVSKLSMLYMADRDKLGLRPESNESRINSHIRPRNHQWELSEVSSADLPPGQNTQFRIRTLNGQALQLDSSNKLTIDRQDQRGNQRTWLIEDLGNGSCTIVNQASQKYLAVRDKGSYNWELTVMAQGEFKAEGDKIWTIQPTSNFTYSISTERNIIVQFKIMRQSFGLAVENDDAILKPKKAAHNQTWLIEPEDALLVPGADQTNPNDLAPGVTDGEYRLKNMDINEYYIRVVKRNDSYIFLTSAQTSANKFKVELKTGGVVFYARLNSKDIYLATNTSGEIAGQEDLAYVWTVTKKNNGNEYLITNKDNKVVGAPSQRNSALTLGSMT